MRYAVVTFGCRVNQADSLVIEGELRRRGATGAPAETADLVVVNTCSVTASADQGARQTIRRIARVNPRAQVVVTGCYATRRPGDLRDLPNVVQVIGNSDKDTAAQSIARRMGLTTAERFADGDGACGAPLEPGVAGRTALTLRVQTGCEEACSYCIIPITRGACRSKPLSGVLDDVRMGVAAGYKEIWITGVHLGSYGRDLAPASSLRELVAALSRVEDDVLFRISSLEPMDCTEAIVDLAASSPRIAPHFHLPLQHGSDEMLRAMRRPYTAAYYANLVTRIHRLLPQASIGSDVIVGFPGENDHHFDELQALLTGLPLSYLHVFPYSDRPGTEASGRPLKVDGAVVRQRGAAVRAKGAALASAFRGRQAGTVRRALTLDDGRSAVTDNYVKVPLAEPRPRNTWVQVAI